MTKGSFSTSSPKNLQYHIDDHDHISKVPNLLLQMIVSKLSTEEAVRTSVLSSRWVDVWKLMSHLVLDTREVLDTTAEEHKHLHRLSDRLARSMTKIINNHCVRVESCIVHHYVSQLKNGTLQNWLHSLNSLKHTKDLTLINYIPATRRYNEANLLSLHPDTFSHHSLSSLSLCGYTMIGSHAFRKCNNLKTLKLANIFISQPSVCSDFLVAFSSLEVIVLNVNFLTPHGVLKIENNSLKFLQLSFPYEIDRMEVYATCLNVLNIDSRFIDDMRDNFILVAPNIKVNKNACLGHGDCPHLYYNVSSNLAQSKVEMCGTAQDIHKMGREAYAKKYRGILLQVKAQEADIEKKHLAELEKYSISDQMKLFDVMDQKGVSYFNIKEEKDRLENELEVAEEKWSAIEVPHVGWFKVGEPWMAKPRVAFHP